MKMSFHLLLTIDEVNKKYKEPIKYNFGQW